MTKKDSANKIDKIIDSIVLSVESDYLITKNRERCATILSQASRSQDDIIDTLIYLHMVLETSLNGLFRNISLDGLKKTVNELDVVENLDKVSFIDKTTMFIYNSSFDFENEIDKATEFHKVIGKLKNFSGIRNQLLHGHAILTINNQGTKSHSPLKKQLNDETLLKQVKDFQYILDGVRFYLEHLQFSSIAPQAKNLYIERYLTYSFIPISYLE